MIDVVVCPHCAKPNLHYLTRCVHCLCDMTVADRAAAEPSEALRAFLRPSLDCDNPVVGTPTEKP